MVRLKESLVEELEQVKQSFNSSMVRLKDHPSQYSFSDFESFQFLDGAIKRWRKRLIALEDKSFNSSMVRLKVSFWLLYPEIFLVFQFLDGAIKSASPRRELHRKDRVSIPRWCD